MTGEKGMKNKLFLMISVIMVCSLCACRQQETNMEQTETKEQKQLQDVKPSYKEFRDVFR